MAYLTDLIDSVFVCIQFYINVMSETDEHLVATSRPRHNTLLSVFTRCLQKLHHISGVSLTCDLWLSVLAVIAPLLEGLDKTSK